MLSLVLSFPVVESIAHTIAVVDYPIWVCVSAFCDVRTRIKWLNNAFLRTYSHNPHSLAVPDYTLATNKIPSIENQKEIFYKDYLSCKWHVEAVSQGFLNSRFWKLFTSLTVPGELRRLPLHLPRSRSRWPVCTFAVPPSALCSAAWTILETT